MDISASDIYSFYQSKLGGLVKRIIRQKIISSIDKSKHSDVCGYGYVSPYLSFINKHFHQSNVLEFRPDFLDGAIQERVDFNQKFIHEYFLPLEPSMVDIVISTHLLEFVEKPQSSIEEIWRILRPMAILFQFYLAVQVSGLDTTITPLALVDLTPQHNLKT